MTPDSCDVIRSQSFHKVDSPAVMVMRCCLKVLVKVFLALEFCRLETRYSSVGCIQERNKRFAVHQRSIFIVWIGFLQARIGAAQRFDVFAILAY